MKKITLTLNLVLLVFTIIAQPKPTNNEVKNLIQDGRDKLVKEITEGNHKKAMATLRSLKNKWAEDYIVLYPREEFMVALATRNFKQFADSAITYNSAIIDPRTGFVYNDFRNELYLYMLPEIMNISRQMEESNLPELQKEVIRIYIYFLFNDDISALNKQINQFERKHSRSLFNNYLNSLRRLTLNGRLNFSLGYSGECFGGKIKDSYYNVLTLTKIELDGFIRKTYFSLFIGGGFTDINTSYLLQDENNEISKVLEDKVSSLKYGLKLGRVIHSSDAIKIFPYISAGGYEISPSSVIFGPENVVSADEIKVGTYYAGAGISSDVVLKKWNQRKMYDPEGYFFIRPTVGYDYSFYPGNGLNKNNFYISISMGVSIGPKK